MAVVDLWTRPELVGGKVKRVRTEQWGRGRRWLVRWRDEADVQRKASFVTRDEAEAKWADLRLSPKLRGERRTVAEGWDAWYRTKAALDTGTRDNYEAKWRLHVAPEWGDRPIASIRHSEVSGWVAELAVQTSPSVARQSLHILSGILATAVRDRLLAANPCAGVSAPRQHAREGRHLEPSEIAALVGAMGDDGIVVRTLAYTGIRWGELAGLEVHDLARGRLRIARVVTERAGRLAVKPYPKNYLARDVPVPPSLYAALEHAAEGRGRAEPLLPAARGGVRRHSAFYRKWRRVLGAMDAELVKRGLATSWAGLHVHDMRHTAASLMIRSGADVKIVQRSLGHKTATMTLDLYGHMWDSGLDDVAARMAALETD